MKIKDTAAFLKQPSILPTPLFLGEKSEPYLYGKISETQTLEKFRKLNPPPLHKGGGCVV